MKRKETTCADTDEGDLDARYAARELSDAEAESFEAHYFACERCWSMVQRAVEIRAVAVRTPAARVGGTTSSTGPWRSVALAAAAAIVLVVGTWRIEAWRRPDPAVLAMRSAEDSLHLLTQTRGSTLLASWARSAGASSYRARLYSTSGRVLHQREVTDTTIAVTRASLPDVAPGAALYWEIEALDRTRRVVMRSGLRQVHFPLVGG
jgi:hypothetical protein